MTTPAETLSALAQAQKPHRDLVTVFSLIGRHLDRERPDIESVAELAQQAASLATQLSLSVHSLVGSAHGLEPAEDGSGFDADPYGSSRPDAEDAV